MSPSSNSVNIETFDSRACIAEAMMNGAPSYVCASGLWLLKIPAWYSPISIGMLVHEQFVASSVRILLANAGIAVPVLSDQRNCETFVAEFVSQGYSW